MEGQNQPIFVRLSKAEKKQIKKDHMKQIRKANKEIKKNKRKLEHVVIPMSDEEIQIQRKKKADERTAVEARMNKAQVDGLKVCVDLSFSHLHPKETECNSLAKQLSLSYAALRSALLPVNFYITSLDSESNVVPALVKMGYESWKVTKSTQKPWEVFSKENLVVLSPDSTNVLSEFDKSKVYVVGGIVDRSVKKGVTLNYANEMDIQTARLPIQEYIPQRQTHILNIDTMIKIICDFQETNDWLATLTKCVPQRKQQKVDNK